MKKLKLISTFLIAFLLILSSVQIHAQETQSDNTDMAPPGIVAFLSGSSSYLKSVAISPMDGGAVYPHYDKIKSSMTMFFDPEKKAMRVDFDAKEKREIDKSASGLGPFGFIITTKPGQKVKQMPMYFDNSGFVYTASKNKGYIKVPFEKLSTLMPGQGFLSMGINLPLSLPDGSVTYYGMDVSPKKFPILEWVFVYKTSVFEGNGDFTKEIVNCSGDANCVKYILKAGEGAGSYVLFDSKQRLREIHTMGSGYITYTYQEVNVNLPEATDMSSFF